MSTIDSSGFVGVSVQISRGRRVIDPDGGEIASFHLFQGRHHGGKFALSHGDRAPGGAGDQDDPIRPPAGHLVKKGLLAVRLAVAMAHHHRITGLAGRPFGAPEHLQEEGVQAGHHHQRHACAAGFEVAGGQIGLVTKTFGGFQDAPHRLGPQHLGPGQRTRDRGDRQAEVCRDVLDRGRIAPFHVPETPSILSLP